VRNFLVRVLVVGTIFAVALTGCDRKPGNVGVSELEKTMQLKTRLEAADFRLVASDDEAVAKSWEALGEGSAIPQSWKLDFAGVEVAVPRIDPADAIGIAHTNGRITAVYPMPNPPMPKYGTGEIVPIAVAYYMIPEPRLDIILLLVCFQYDPKGSNQGIGVKSVNMEGVEVSAPFALALKPEELSGMFFYDEFISGSDVQRVAARKDWDQGFLLLTMLGADVILSTYVPWY